MLRRHSYVCICDSAGLPKNGEVVDYCTSSYHSCICNHQVMRGFWLSSGNFSCRAHAWEDGAALSPDVDTCRQILSYHSPTGRVMQPPVRSNLKR